MSTATARQRLRVLEDQLLGSNEPRIVDADNVGHIERGFGSRFAALSPANRQQFDIHDQLIEAEDKMVAARGEAIAAGERLQAATAAHAAILRKIER